MGKSDSVDEVLEYAIDREIQANRFYLALAERVDNPEHRQVFEELAKEELEHKAKLELEVMKLGKTTKIKEPTGTSETAYSIPDDESLADMDYKEMLMMAIEKEEASFRTYVNLIPRVYDAEAREILLSLAQEEVRHKLRFQSEYDMIMKHH